jgi:hypothetical protein
LNSNESVTGNSVGLQNQLQNQEQFQQDVAERMSASQAMRMNEYTNNIDRPYPVNINNIEIDNSQNSVGQDSYEADEIQED